MAVLEKCDGCGKVSPTKDRLYISNQWYEIKIQNRTEENRYVDTAKEYLLCEQCVEPVLKIVIGGK